MLQLKYVEMPVLILNPMYQYHRDVNDGELENKLPIVFCQNHVA